MGYSALTDRRRLCYPKQELSVRQLLADGARANNRLETDLRTRTLCPLALARSLALDRKMSSERDKMLFELEQRLAQVGQKLSAENASSLIADDFLEFGASGKVWTKAEIISAMPQRDPNDRIVEDFTVRELSTSICLVTYKAIRVNRQSSPFSLRSSIWRNNGETWQIVFHQGTIVK